MGINIDPNKLKLKYELKVYKKMDSWPCSEDVLYEIARYIEYKEKNKISKSKLLEMVLQDEELLKKQLLQQENETTFILLKHGWE